MDVLFHRTRLDIAKSYFSKKTMLKNNKMVNFTLKPTYHTISLDK